MNKLSTVNGRLKLALTMGYHNNEHETRELLNNFGDIRGKI